MRGIKIKQAKFLIRKNLLALVCLSSMHTGYVWANELNLNHLAINTQNNQNNQTNQKNQNNLITLNEDTLHTFNETIKNTQYTPLNLQEEQAIKDGQLIAMSDAMQAQINTNLNLTGNAKLWWQTYYASAEQINYDYVTQKIKATNDINRQTDLPINAVKKDSAEQNKRTANTVQLNNTDMQTQSSQASYDIDEQTAQLSNVSYRYLLNKGNANKYTINNLDQAIALQKQLQISQEKLSHDEPLIASGLAQTIELNKQIIYVKNGSFTSCPPEDMAWYLNAENFELNQHKQTLFASWPSLYLKGVPIVKLPAFKSSFNRSSGFLTPRFALNSRSGVDVLAPYYFNIAPWHDATLSPRLLSKRGMQLGGEFRYLRDNYTGQLSTQWLGKDSITKAKRWAYDISHQHNFSALPNLKAYAKLQRVSDINYSDDFGLNVNEYTQRIYSQEAGLSYQIQSKTLGNVFASARYAHYQALGELAPYHLKPQLHLEWQKELPKQLQLNVQTDFNQFKHATLAQAKRLSSDVQLSRRWQGIAYFVEPAIWLKHRYYRYNQSQNTLANNYTKQVTVPGFQVDGGLFFDRYGYKDGQKTGAKQVLEPRLMYRYSPSRKQNMPLFDTKEAEFDLNSLFADRYLGQDRVSDEHSIALALASRWLDANGQETLWLNIGQRYQFRDTQANINTALPKGVSDLLLQGRWRYSGHVSQVLDVQYNPKTKTMGKLDSNLIWRPTSYNQVSLNYKQIDKAYTSDKQSFKQVYLNSKVNLNHQWQLINQLSYDVKAKQLGHLMLGLQYNHLCWQTKFGLDRNLGANQKSTTRALFQVVFKGLGQSLP